MESTFSLRAYSPSDCGEMAKLFYETVHTVCKEDCTPEQLDAWATGEVDLEKWNKKFLANHTVIAVSGDRIVGLGDVEKGGYLDFLYVHKDFQRMGIATAICDELEKETEADLMSVHASITARPFFEARGYRLIKEQQVIRFGVTLTNYVMEKCKGDSA